MTQRLRFGMGLLALWSCGVLTGCLGANADSAPPATARSQTETSTEVALADKAGSDVSTKTVKATAGDDGDGGASFKGVGWTTANPGPLGDPKAVRGGTMLTNMPDWPENLRVYGIASNTYLNSIVEGLCYESLLSMNPNTLEFVPSLASHWKISDDKLRFSFRLDPRAKWSDGSPVTTADVMATFNLIMDETLQEPMARELLSRFKPVAKSPYLLEVECKEKHWRNFITFTGFKILPAKDIGKITGKEYLDQFNFKYTLTCGPYIVDPKDVKQNESLTITRRKDYWGDALPQNKGLYNVDKIRFVVIRDDRLAFDKACKGELDFYVVYTAKWWVEDLPKTESVTKGHLVRRKVYTKYPAGFQGLACNMRTRPLDDVRVRKALAHLFDRKTMLEKFAYNEYDRLKSYFPGSNAENQDNKMVEFDQKQASELLADAGWKERGSDGILIKEGNRLSLTINYDTPFLEKYFTTWKEDCKKVGVEIKLSQITHETQWQNAQERKFEITTMAWALILFPEPRTSYHSKMADQKGSNNIVGLANSEADKLIEQYDQEYDLTKRTELLRKLDGVIFNDHPYVMNWYLPCERFVYWNKFGMPDTCLHKFEDWRGVFASWWVDPDLKRELDAAKKSGKAMKAPPIEVKPWDAGANAKTAAK